MKKLVSVCTLAAVLLAVGAFFFLPSKGLQADPADRAIPPEWHDWVIGIMPDDYPPERKQEILEGYVPEGVILILPDGSVVAAPSNGEGGCEIRRAMYLDVPCDGISPGQGLYDECGDPNTCDPHVNCAYSYSGDFCCCIDLPMAGPHCLCMPSHCTDGAENANECRGRCLDPPPGGCKFAGTYNSDCTDDLEDCPCDCVISVYPFTPANSQQCDVTYYMPAIKWLNSTTFNAGCFDGEDCEDFDDPCEYTPYGACWSFEGHIIDMGGDCKQTTLVRVIPKLDGQGQHLPELICERDLEDEADNNKMIGYDPDCNEEDYCEEIVDSIQLEEPCPCP